MTNKRPSADEAATGNKQEIEDVWVKMEEGQDNEEIPMCPMTRFYHFFGPKL
jgi:hypothetical protein